MNVFIVLNISLPQWICGPRINYISNGLATTLATGDFRNKTTGKIYFVQTVKDKLFPLWSFPHPLDQKCINMKCLFMHFYHQLFSQRRRKYMQSLTRKRTYNSGQMNLPTAYRFSKLITALAVYLIPLCSSSHSLTSSILEQGNSLWKRNTQDLIF